MNKERIETFAEQIIADSYGVSTQDENNQYILRNIEACASDILEELRND